MASGRLIADGQTESVNSTDLGLHVAVHGTFGGGTITVKHKVEGEEFNMLDNGTAITLTAADDFELRTKSGDTVFLELSGATSPNIKWAIRR